MPIFLYACPATGVQARAVVHGRPARDVTCLPHDWVRQCALSRCSCRCCACRHCGISAHHRRYSSGRRPFWEAGHRRCFRLAQQGLPAGDRVSRCRCISTSAWSRTLRAWRTIACCQARQPLMRSYLAIVPGIVGHTGLNTVLKYISPLVITLSTTTEPLIGACIGAPQSSASSNHLHTVACALQSFDRSMRLQGTSF